MGLKNFLKKTLGSAQLTWSEPIGFRVRLRGDLFLRVLIAVGAWAGGTGLLFGLLWLTKNPTSNLTVIGLGLIPGACVLAGLMMTKSQASGNVDLRLKEIYRATACYAVIYLQTVEERWRFSGITSCTLIPGEEIGQSFTVMRITGADFDELIGIPRRISVKQVAKILREGGVNVGRGNSLPRSATKPLPMAAALIAVAVGAVLLAGGTWLYFAGPANPNPLRKPPAFFQPPPPQNPPRLPAVLPGNVRPGPAVQPAGPIPKPAVTGPKMELTEAVGGPGGFAFNKSDLLSRPVLGVRYILSDWAGKKRVSLLTPVFTASSIDSPGTVAAKDGYAMGAIHVCFSEFVDGVTLEFMKLREDGSLDPSDSYKAEPIGEVSNAVKTVTGNGRRVVGIHGRGGAVMDAVGLVLAPE